MQGGEAAYVSWITEKQRDAIAASGLTPLDYLLSVMRDENADAEIRRDAAKAAAPYVHPRLSAVEMKAEVDTHESFIERYRAKKAAAADQRH